MLCPACGVGRVLPLKKIGKIFNGKEISSEIEIPTCLNCDEWWVDYKTAVAIDNDLKDE
jgi:hypothetical protein